MRMPGHAGQAPGGSVKRRPRGGRLSGRDFVPEHVERPADAAYRARKCHVGGVCIGRGSRGALGAVLSSCSPRRRTKTPWV
jgi:hypothetical protein